MSVLHDLRARCETAGILVQATEEEWVALVAHQGRLYRQGAMEYGMEFAGCMVVSPWEWVPPMPRAPWEKTQVAKPEAFADAMLLDHGHTALVDPKLEPRYGPKGRR